jgi:hypothetical protein
MKTKRIKFFRNSIPAMAWIFVTVLTAPAWADSISSFNTDSEGWGSAAFLNVSNFPDFASLQSTSEVTYNSTGGNPGGYISKADPDGNWQYFSAPAAFLGDDTGDITGVLSFDELILNTFGFPALNPQGPIVAATNGTLTLVYSGGGTTPPISGTAWNSLSVPLLAASWNVSTPAGAIATVGQFNSVWSSLTGLYILSDYWTGSGANGEIIGLDNVKLLAPSQTSATPEPGTAGVCLIAFGALGAFLRRVRRR